MSPERWQQIEDIFQTALDLAPEERNPYVTKACAGDADLKRQAAKLDSSSHNIPVIDITALVRKTDGRHEVSTEIGRACRESGFFYVVGHNVDESLQQRLEEVSRRFFAESADAKLEISMSRAGRAWRGYFPVGRELTSGKPDLKEGIYFGAELDSDHPMVKAGAPMHGANLFPSGIEGFRETVLDYMSQMTRLGHSLMSGIALSLGLEESYFADRYTSDPLVLFRIFNYPPARRMPELESNWGVGEHTDYGLLTMLKQDMSGGLEVKVKSRWVAAPPIPNSFVCNIGDMLDRMTGGLYLSTPHRVQKVTTHDRLSFPCFFDPNFNAEIKPIEIRRDVTDNKAERWDRASVHEFRGTYGDYLIGKVSKVFPDLRREVV
ncbi:MAG: 2-oxoglutarate and iron-dependent oxygenase domain-containing protein [Blastocatellia bacterium]